MVDQKSNTIGNTLLLLGAGRSQLPVILSAHELGLNIVAIDPDPAVPGLALANWGYVLDLSDLAAILRVANEHDIGGVMTMAADFPMPTVAFICEALNLAGPATGAVAKATNKRLMRKALYDAGVSIPRYIHVESVEDAKQAVGELGLDTVFKPAMSSGGRGVTRVPKSSSNITVEQAFHRALSETRADGVLVEEYIDGAEFSVETLTCYDETKVLAVTDKSTSGPPYYVETGHSQPSRLPLDLVTALGETSVAAIEALGIRQAAGHTELRISDQGPVVIETAARLGGGFIASHLVPLSTGVNLVAATIQIAMGQVPDLEPRATGRGAAIRFLSAKPGRVLKSEGVESARCIDGVEEIALYVNQDDLLARLVDARGRPGHVICSAENPAEAIALAERVANKVRIVTEADPVRNEK